jgi:2-deoxy-D-gluconate 3-dehydrogenase
MSYGPFSLHGRVALVTGGNGGLGRAIALGLRAAGATLAVTGRDSKKNAAIAKELDDPDAVIALDVRDEDAVRSAVTRVVERLGHLDILVNNAGNAHVGPALELSRDDWRSVIETHLTGSFYCSKHAARAMAQRGEGGKIINIGSMYSLYGAAHLASYTAAKTGLLGLTRALAVELAEHAIQVNAILPGWFETNLTHGMPQSEAGEQIRRKTPAGRWGKPQELVGAAIFLASSASDFITGIALPVDGGYSIADRLLPEPRLAAAMRE